MSISLIVEVLDRAPETLTSGERLVLVVIAEWANDNTREARQTHGWNLETICRRAGIKRSGLKSVLQGLAKKGLEVRVPVKVKDGKPVYAYEGTALTFRVPPMPERGGHSIPSDGLRGVATASERGGCGISEGRPQPPPSPQGSPLKKNPSSLSGNGATDPGSSVAAQRTERENEDASLEVQKNERRGTAYSVLALEGVTDEEADRFIAWIGRTGHKGGGWFRRVYDNGDLTDHVQAFREEDAATATCPVCDDLGEVGDYLNRRPCSCLWWKDEGAARTAFMAQLKDMEDCAHGVPGGDVESPNGWRHCAMCRGPGWVAKDSQPRSSDRIRSPADQRVADGVELYNKYRRLEESA